MKQRARLVIPFWGATYAGKVTSVTIPALLAPGNLPALCEMFDVEVMLVTENKLFESVLNSLSVQKLSTICEVRLVALDHILTDLPGDYGVVLSYAYFLGFVDLGEKMTDVYLLFLNADFIVADGSYRHLGNLLLAGKLIVQAPSFRVVLEDAWPQLLKRTDPTTSALSLTPREMVKFALLNKHVTVKARTVNQRLSHQWRMDQCYWYVDEDTMLCRQWLIALLAIKPERVVTEPAFVWDFGFIPEGMPTAKKHFILDSDQFFMIEPQKRMSGDDLVRLGWISQREIGEDLSVFVTREHHECARQPLIFHAGDIPPTIETSYREAEEYMAGIFEHVSPVPQPHTGNPDFARWFGEAKARMIARNAALLAPPPVMQVEEPCVAEEPASPTRFARTVEKLATLMSHYMKQAYQAIFGDYPAVTNRHPCWIDTHVVSQKITAWKGKKILLVSTLSAAFADSFQSRVDPSNVLIDSFEGPMLEGAPYDGCLFSLNTQELLDLRKMYEIVRPLVKNGGEIVVHIINLNATILSLNDIHFCDQVLPGEDVSEIHFYGSPSLVQLQRIYQRSASYFTHKPLLRQMFIGATLIALVPFVKIANASVASESTRYKSVWSSLVINFAVRKRVNAVDQRQLPLEMAS